MQLYRCSQRVATTSEVVLGHDLTHNYIDVATFMISFQKMRMNHAILMTIEGEDGIDHLHSPP
jgi:hypothetical protein